jgi:hypothetical protein
MMERNFNLKTMQVKAMSDNYKKANIKLSSNIYQPTDSPFDRFAHHREIPTHQRA